MDLKLLTDATGHAAPGGTGPVGKDVVCGMSVPLDSPHRHEYQGRKFVFCCARCRERFAANPDAFLNHAPQAGDPSGAPAPAKPLAANYTCPMHPEVFRDRPGACPICGMALEPRDAAVEDDTELREMSRRFVLASALTVPLVVLAMEHLLPGAGLSGRLSMRARVLVELALATPVCL